MGLLMRSRPVPNGTAAGAVPSCARYPSVGSLPADDGRAILGVRVIRRLRLLG